MSITPSPFLSNQSQNPNIPNNHAYHLPPPCPSSESILLPLPGVVGPPSSQFSYNGPHSIASQSYFQTVPESDYRYSAAAYAANQMNQQLYLSRTSTFEAMGIGSTSADLEMKTLKVLQGGAPADSVRTCIICNVVCNSDKVFASHLAGEKHKLKALGRPSNNALKPKVPPHVFTKRAVKSTPKISAAKKITASMRGVNFVQSSYCDVCKIDCNSQDVLNNHRLGKKHLKNLLKLQESITPKPVNTNTSTSETKAATKDDLETKKLKVLSGGAAADAVRVCTHCNVVCNSEEVYNSHVVGKKHIANVNKQQQAAPLV